MTKNPAISAQSVSPRVGSRYPAEFAAKVSGREKRALGDAFALTQFGVNLVTLPSGSKSALRHWHDKEDEFVFVVAGELVLIDDSGEQLLTMGMCQGFKAGDTNAHCLVNRSAQPALYLEVGSRIDDDKVFYPDDDLQLIPVNGDYQFQHRDGRPYEK